MLSSNPTIATLNYLSPLTIADKLGFGATAEHVKIGA